MAGALDHAVEALVRRGWVQGEQVPCARLCVEEALANAVRHGNQQDPNLSVRIEIEDEDDVCEIRVYDEGNGFRPDDIALPDSEQIGGRGICLMRHYMEEVVYLPEEHCLKMSFRRPGKAC